jgi:hypothetical protein
MWPPPRSLTTTGGVATGTCRPDAPCAGPDGADRRLLAEAETPYVSDHYDRVVVGSGDGIFAGRALELRRAGVVVGVVSRRRSLSGDLRRVASFTRSLDGVRG